MLIDESIETVMTGERAAVEAYQKVAKKLPGGVFMGRINEMEADHEDALNFWMKQAASKRIETSGGSSTWATVVKNIVGFTASISEEAALKALQKGEEQGLRYYQNLLNSENLSPFQKDQIRNKFIPEHQKHIVTLKSLAKTV